MSSVLSSDPNTGNRLLVLSYQCSVRSKRRSQPPMAASYPGLPEGSRRGPGLHDRPARGHTGAAYPVEASAEGAGRAICLAAASHFHKLKELVMSEAATASNLSVD